MTCSLLSHHISTPNELICLTPAAIRLLSIEGYTDRLFVYLAVKCQKKHKTKNKQMPEIL